jgi:uncharacterized membrane protein
MFGSMTGVNRKVYTAIAVLGLAGIIVSSVSLYHHFGTTATKYCDFGESFNCDIVNRSIYSTVFGIPVALIGIFGYALLLLLATLYRSRPNAPLLLITASTLGLGFALYLTYIEAYVLGAWCVLCLSSLSIIVLITVLASVLAAQALRQD